MGKINELFINITNLENDIKSKKIRPKFTNQKLFNRDVIILINSDNLDSPFFPEYETNYPHSNYYIVE